MNKEWLKNQYNSGKSQRKIAKECGVSYNTIYYWMRKLGIISRRNWGKWKMIDKTGSIYIRFPNHPNSTKAGYVYEHRLVIEEKLGRYLTKEERVHHLDGDNTNNKVENLTLCKNTSHHRKLHKNLENVAFELYKKGVIKFDGDKYI